MFDTCRELVTVVPQWRDDNDPEGVASELRWLETLSEETPLVVPRPVPAHTGNLVA